MMAMRYEFHYEDIVITIITFKARFEQFTE
jgi:hypothetical protein